MTLSSRHSIWNSSPGGLRPSTLPLGHGGSPQYWLSHVDGEETFCFFQTAETGNRAPNSGVKGSGANHYPRAPAETISLDKHWFNVLYLVGILWGETQNSARKIQSHSSWKNKLYGLNFYVVTGILPYILLMNAWRWSRIAIRYVWRHCEVYPTPRRHFSLFRLLIEFELLLERDVYSWG